MRKIFLYGALGIVLLTAAGCRDYLDFSNEDEKGIKAKGTQAETFIVFDNRGADNIVPVKIYSNANRAEGDHIATIPKNSQSSPQIWEPAPNGYNFYISYDLYFRDDIFSSGNINITYPLNDAVSVRIDAAKTTPVLIPSLASKTGGDKDAPLFQDKYLVIKANGEGFQLRRGNTNITPINNTATLINAGETAVYRLSSSESLVSYSISGKPFPDDAPLQNGYIFFFSFNGSTISYRDSKAITVNNLNATL
ncbi:MAG: hypothetical protein LBH75_03840 [Treponema sp.]|jgi:hypothetical protein|nr:hypothetical protein [Treponema sp.]